MSTTTKNLLNQYEEMKKKRPDVILLFRVGVYYETFKEDALAVSDILGIRVVYRSLNPNEAVELCGFPSNFLDTYLPRLVRAGYRVAIFE